MTLCYDAHMSSARDADATEGATMNDTTAKSSQLVCWCDKPATFMQPSMGSDTPDQPVCAEHLCRDGYELIEGLHELRAQQLVELSEKRAADEQAERDELAPVVGELAIAEVLAPLGLRYCTPSRATNPRDKIQSFTVGPRNAELAAQALADAGYHVFGANDYVVHLIP